MLPVANTFTLNRHLTNLSVAYAQSADTFIADKLFPVIPVSLASGTYTSYPKGDMLRVENHIRAPGTESAGGGFRYESKDFQCHVRAFHKDVDDQTRANAGGAYNLDRDSTAYVTTNLLLGREREFAETYFKTGIWTDVTGVAANPTGSQFLSWADDSSDPVTDVRSRITARQAATGFRPNVGVVTQAVMDRLVNHPDIKERRKYTTSADADNAALAAMFGLDRILVASAIQNVAPEGKPDDIRFVYPDGMLLVYANGTPSLMSLSSGYIFAWNGYTGNAYGAGINRFRMEHLKVDRYEAEMAYGMAVVAADTGIFFASPLA